MERREPYIGPGTPPAPRTERSSSAWPALAGIVVLLAIVAAAAWFFWPRAAVLPAASERATVPTPPSPPVAQAPLHPVPGEPAEQPLPSLAESDGPVAAALAALVGQEAFGRLFIPQHLVRNFVATVDNLPREEMSRRVSPLHPAAGMPATSGSGPGLVLAPANASRYALQMKLVEGVPTDRAVAFYRRHYPLFQQAYMELGYPNGYFNDRLVEVIDHLLETPEPAGPLRLTQPKVLYEFADPALEELSAGQKAMLRIGRENRTRVKAKLREIRAAIVAR